MFLVGEADAGTVEVIAACLDHAPSLGDIDLDLAGRHLHRPDGARAILQFGSQLAASDRSLTVVNPSKPVALLLRVAGFDGVLL